MAKVSIATLDGSAATIEASERIGGVVHAHRLFIRERDPIHVHVYLSEPGASLNWSGGATDLVVFVWKGTMDVEGIRLEKNSSLIVERGARTEATAGESGATVVTFRMVANASAQREGGHVHLLPSHMVPRNEGFAGRRNIGGALYADAACPTCEVWMHENSLREGGFEVALHSHSEDEVIFVTGGTIRLGTRLYGPGTAIAVAANTKYSFSAGPEGVTFINFRGTAATYRTADGSRVWFEAEKWVDEVGGRPKYLELAPS